MDGGYFIAVMVLCIGASLSFAGVLFIVDQGRRQTALSECAKAADVYECHWQAVPGPAQRGGDEGR